MKVILQTRQPIFNPGEGVYSDAIAGDFYIDDDNAVANTAFGVFVIRRADILAALIVPDDTDLSTVPNVMAIN